MREAGSRHGPLVIRGGILRDPAPLSHPNTPPPSAFPRKTRVQCTPTQGFETHNTNARPRTATIETIDTFAPGNCTKNARFSPAKAMVVSIPRMHAQAKAMAVSDERAACRAEP